MAFHPTRFDPMPSLGMQDIDDTQTLPAAPKVELEIVRGTARNTRRSVVGKVFLIGSACDCDLVLGDEQFPDAYAYLFVQPEGVTVRHLGAGPAVTVAGEPVQARRLLDGDVLEFGPYAFRIRIEAAKPAEKPSKPQHQSDRPLAGPHMAIAESAAAKTPSIPSVDDVLDLRVARAEVAQLLSDIAAALEASSDKLKLYRGPETSKVGLSLAERVRRRASA